MRTRIIPALFLTLLALNTCFASDNWPQFRGPKSMGVADDPKLPDTWSATENVAWKTEIPGVGWSSPVVWNNKIFVTSVVSKGEVEAPKKGLYFGGERKASTDEHRWMVYCVNWKTGKILWEREAFKGVPPSSRHLKNSYASETPVTDGERVYVYFGNVGLFCYDMDGKPLWDKRWGPFKTRYGWGTAASPVLHKDRVYVVNDNDDQSFIIALDKKTGNQIWRADREEGSNWATPYIWENELRTEIVTPGTKKVRSYDLNGKLLWELGGDVLDLDPDAVFKVRTGLHYIGLRDGPAAARLRDPPGSVGRHLVERGRARQPAHSMVPTSSRAVQPHAGHLR